MLDIDATLVAWRSEKEQAAATYKGGFGYHPLLCFPVNCLLARKARVDLSWRQLAYGVSDPR
ncbi:hypothetical protein ACFXKC_50665 [Streptomyces sp. NPDC059340]|uniref:hypothetical protein n=1 Tax=Streptomyces sp. NPDC059340 TaxID=3346806 RepID=UPI0036B90BF6